MNASNTGFYTDKEEYFEKLDYLKIPLLFTYRSNADKAVAFIANIGPEMTYITKAEHEIITSNLSSNDIDIYKKTNYGLTLGVGIAIRIIKSLQLNAGIRYDHDFGNITNGYNPIYGNRQSLAYVADIGIFYLL